MDVAFLFGLRPRVAERIAEGLKYLTGGNVANPGVSHASANALKQNEHPVVEQQILRLPI